MKIVSEKPAAWGFYLADESGRRRSFAPTVPRVGRRCQAHREMNVPLRRSLSA